MIKINKKIKIIIFCYSILSLLIIPIFKYNISQKLRLNNVISPLNIMGSSNDIIITRPKISFENDTMILNITDVVANISGTLFNGSASGMPEVHNFSIYLDNDNSFTGITGNLSDSDIDGNWNATVNLTQYSLSPGIYYVKCYFENNSGLDYGISPESDRFAILGKYNITTASVSYDQATQQLNITNITIRNSTTILNNSGVSMARWSIFYNETGSNTSYSGILNYNNVTKHWNATNIDVSNLSEGTYFIISSFKINSHLSVSDLDRSILQTFTIIHQITITNLYYNYTGKMVQQVKLGIMANTSYQGGTVGRQLISNEANVSYTIIYTNNGSSTNISGSLTWTQNSWNTTIDVSILKEGNYNITINISHISSDYLSFAVQNTSKFEIIHKLQLNIPQPTFNRGPATVDILGITVLCSYSLLGYLNDTQVDLHYFKIYNSSNKFIGINGNLSFNSQKNTWESIGILLENFSEGLYYISVFFNSSMIPEGAMSNSTKFEIIHVINFQPFHIHYINGFQQILNITGISAVSSYYPFSKLQGYDAFNTHNYSFYNYSSKNPANPPLTGMLEWNGTYWNAYNVDVSNLPVGEYYVVLNFADNISINSYGRPNQNNFTISHTINISVPIINYTGGFTQKLSITNITCQTSFSPQAFLNSTTALNHTYYIFNSTFELTGNLVWNDPYWEAIDIDVSELQPGNYRVRCFFASDEAGSIFSVNSSIFHVSHVFNISKPLISFDSNKKLLDIFGIKVYSSHKEFITNNTAITHKYQIFNSNNISTNLIGSLTWNISTQCWEAKGIDVSSLGPGTYYVKVNFSIYNVLEIQTSNSSQNFEIPTPPAQNPDLSWIFILIILLLIIPFVIGFIRRLFINKEEK